VAENGRRGDRSRVRRGFLIHAAASFDTLIHCNETVNVSRLREQEIQKPDLLIFTRLVYTQKYSIILQSRLGDSPVREPAIFRKILDGMFGIVVVPRHTVMIQEGEELRLIFHIPLDLVVDHWTSDGESRSHRDVLLLHDVWTTSNRLSGHKITSTISMS